MDDTTKKIQPVPDGVPVKKEKITADGEAAKYLQLQMHLKKESRGADLLLILLTLGFIYVMAVLFWVLPDSDFSPQENRTLAAAPELSAENFFSGNLTEQVSDYMADQFPFRDFFVGLKALSETAQLKGQNNGVILGSDGYLITRVDYPNETVLNTNLNSAARFQQAAQKQGIQCVTAFAGRKQDTCDKYLPAAYGSYYADRIWGILDDIALDVAGCILCLYAGNRSTGRCPPAAGYFYGRDSFRGFLRYHLVRRRCKMGEARHDYVLSWQE